MGRCYPTRRPLPYLSRVAVDGLAFPSVERDHFAGDPFGHSWDRSIVSGGRRSAATGPTFRPGSTPADPSSGGRGDADCREVPETPTSDRTGRPPRLWREPTRLARRCRPPPRRTERERRVGAHYLARCLAQIGPVRGGRGESPVSVGCVEARLRVFAQPVGARWHSGQGCRSQPHALPL